MRIYLLLAVLFLNALIVCTGAAANDSQRGKRLAETHCAICHSVERQGESPLRSAPPFRSLHHRYPVESLEEALAEGIVTGHPQMPMFRFNARQIGDLIAFLKTLE